MSAAAWMLSPANPASPTHPDNMETTKNTTEAATTSGDPATSAAIGVIIALALVAFFLYIEVHVK